MTVKNSLIADEFPEFSIYHKLYRNEQIDEMLETLNEFKTLKPGLKLYITGGGAFRFKEYIEVLLV